MKQFEIKEELNWSSGCMEYHNHYTKDKSNAVIVKSRMCEHIKKIAKGNWAYFNFPWIKLIIKKNNINELWNCQIESKMNDELIEVSAKTLTGFVNKLEKQLTQLVKIGLEENLVKIKCGRIYSIEAE